MKNLINFMSALFFIAANAYSESYPKATGYVNDFANLLTIEQGQMLNDKLVALESKTSVEIAVVTISSLGEYTIEDYTTGLAEAWAVGKKDKNNGVVFLIAPNERKMRIETASGARRILTDRKANWIRDNKVLPYFRSQNIPQGIIAGTEEIIGVFDKDSVEILAEKPLDSKVGGHVKRKHYLQAEKQEGTILFPFILSLLGVLGTIIYIICALTKSYNIKNSLAYVLGSKESVAERFADLSIKVNNPFVDDGCKSELAELCSSFAKISGFSLASKGVDWPNASRELQSILTSLSFLEERVERQIKFGVDAYIKGPRLYDEIPAMIDATSNVLAKGEHSPDANRCLEEARSEYRRAVSLRSGMTMVDWFILYQILSAVSSNRERAEYVHHKANSPDYNTGSSSRRSGGTSPAFGFGGNKGFSGGGGFGRSSGGGGSSGSW